MVFLNILLFIQFGHHSWVSRKLALYCTVWNESPKNRPSSTRWHILYFDKNVNNHCARFKQKQRLGCTHFKAEVCTLPHQCLSRLHTSALKCVHPSRCFCLNRTPLLLFKNWRYFGDLSLRYRQFLKSILEMLLVKNWPFRSCFLPYFSTQTAVVLGPERLQIWNPHFPNSLNGPLDVLEALQAEGPQWRPMDHI